MAETTETKEVAKEQTPPQPYKILTNSDCGISGDIIIRSAMEREFNNLHKAGYIYLDTIYHAGECYMIFKRSN